MTLDEWKQWQALFQERQLREVQDRRSRAAAELLDKSDRGRYR